MLDFQSASTSLVKIDVINVNGTSVVTLLEENMNSGTHTGSYNLNKSGASLLPGIYICRLQVDDKVITQKFIVR